jgi:VanZ family protein
VSSTASLPSLTPGLPRLQEVLGHMTVYGVLALLLKRALGFHSVARPWLWALIGAVLYGLSDEFHQSFVPGRAAEFFDIAVDTVGACLALAGARLWEARHR